MDAPALTEAETFALVERIKQHATELAAVLTEASDAGVSHALILPELMLIFRASFGDLPAGFTMPGVG